MSNSSLATYIDTGSNNWNYRNQPISRITIHHCAGVCSLESLSSIIRSREVSYNYGIDNSGRIGLYVDESHRAWTSSSPSNDHMAVTIEVSNSSVGGDWPVSNAAYASLLNLCEDICRRNGIRALTYTGRLEGSNLTMHQWFANTACPGPYLKARFPAIASEVNRRLGSSTSSVATSVGVLSGTAAVNAYTAATTGFVDRSIINYEYLDPYIITIDRNSPDINYSRMKDVGVVGAMIEAGYLYDSIHSEVSYNNPKLKSQVQACVDADIPFALYCDVKARSVAEAKRELYYLAFCIRLYPPALGVWLHLQLVKSQSINNSIIDTYYEELVRLGLKDRVGFYVTRSELQAIDWDKYKDTWYLWWNFHIDNISDINQLMVPQFFVLDESTIAEREAQFVQI